MEPAVQAVLASNPDIIKDSIGLFACGSTLGNLLRCARGNGNPFRMLVEVVGNTVFFIRHENSPTELIPGIVGYGHTFPEAYTTSDKEVKGSDLHQHIIRYEFFGLQCLLRFEADGYLKDKVPSNSPVKAPKAAKAATLEDLTSHLQDSSVATVPSTAGEDLHVIHRGQSVPQSAVFDLKTRSFKKRATDTLAGELPRLWIRQIPNFILAYHAYGHFDDIQVQDVHHEIVKWQGENESSLRLLGVLLRTIVDFARNQSNGKVVVHYSSLGIIEFRKPSGSFGKVLSASSRKQWSPKSTKLVGHEATPVGRDSGLV